MPQAALHVIGFLGGPLGVAPAAALDTVGIHVSGGFIGDLLGIGRKSPKPAQAEYSIKTSTAARIHVLGKRRVHGAAMLWSIAEDSDGLIDVWMCAE